MIPPPTPLPQITNRKSRKLLPAPAFASPIAAALASFSMKIRRANTFRRFAATGTSSQSAKFGGYRSMPSARARAGAGRLLRAFEELPGGQDDLVHDHPGTLVRLGVERNLFQDLPLPVHDARLDRRAPHIDADGERFFLGQRCFPFHCLFNRSLIASSSPMSAGR